MPRFPAPLLFLCILVMARCAGPKAVETPRELPALYPNHTAAQILDLLALRPDTLQAFSATVSISMHTPENEGSFNARLSHRRDDSLSMSIRVTFGIEAARTLVTPDSFFVYDRINKVLYLGPLAEAAGMLPGPVAGPDRFTALLGLTLPDATTAWRITADSARYVLDDPDGRRTFVVDPTLWRVTRYEERTRSGTILEERIFSDFDVFDSLYLPRRLVYRRPLDDHFASLYYRELDLTPGALSFGLRVGQDVRRVPVTAQ